jgi:Putative heavy-metal-binding
VKVKIASSPKYLSLRTAYARAKASAWNPYAVWMHKKRIAPIDRIRCRQKAGVPAQREDVEAMQVSRLGGLEGIRRYHSIGRIKAGSCWRGANAPAPESDRVAAVKALIREAEEYGADAIVDLDFEVDSVNCVDIGRVPLRRVSATGVAVKFDEAA